MAAPKRPIEASPAEGARDALASGLERADLAWREADRHHALHAADRETLAGCDALRALVLELMARPDPGGRDLYNACARLGRMLADGGASPSLAASTLDGAASALGQTGIPVEPPRLAAARASLAEGYMAVVVERERAAARRAWDYPACAVPVGMNTVAIAAGHPVDDHEALASWSARVALAVTRAGFKKAVLSGPEAAKAELGEALSLVGVELTATVQTTSWLSSLLKR